MIDGGNVIRRVQKKLALLSFGSVFVFGFAADCSNMLVGVTRYVDPCGTVLANCQPGDFQVNAADVGDFCVDPACTVPGGCGTGQQPLGTITDVCP